MKCIEKVKEIVDSYDLKPIILPDGYKNIYQLIIDIPEISDNYKSDKDDVYLNEKYDKYIPNGWYGFDLGSPTPPEWFEIIDKVVEYLIEIDPNFQIHQIKMKFGGLRFYVESDIIEDIFDIELLLEHKLFDKALIY